MKNKNIDKIVIGIDNKKQCLELIENENQIENAFEYYDELKKLKVEDINILLPYKWKK